MVEFVVGAAIGLVLLAVFVVVGGAVLLDRALELFARTLGG